MNPMYRSDWTGKAVVAIVIAIMAVLAAAFMLGSAASEQLQWLNPDIAKAIADFKHQEARNLQLVNDKLEIANARLQALTAIEIADKQAWSALWPRLVEMLVGAVADVMRVVGVGLALLIGYWGYRQIGNRVPQPAPAQKRVLPFERATPRTRILGFQVDPPNAAKSSETSRVSMRLETPKEKERYRPLRELGRRHEAERRQALMAALYDQGGDAMI